MKDNRTRWARFKEWLEGWMPVTKRHMWETCDNAEAVLRILLAKEKADQHQRHQQELERVKRRVDEHIQRFSQVRYRRERDGRSYALMVRFSPDMIRGFNCREDLQFIGERIGQQVAHDIATARFVQDANDNEAERLGMEMNAYRHLLVDPEQRGGERDDNQRV